MQDMFEAGVSSKELAADMAITRRKSSVEVLQRHNQTSVDVFRRHSSLGVMSTFLCPLLLHLCQRLHPPISRESQTCLDS